VDQYKKDLNKALTEETYKGKEKEVDELATRYLYLVAHGPLTFVERKVDPEEERKKLEKQKEAIRMLGAFEANLTK